MLLYRVAMKKFATDLTGEGARLAGGRWNSKGTPLIYTADHPALAFLEVYASMSSLNLPPTLQLVVFEVPDDWEVRSIDTAQLPAGWNSHPPRHATMRLGDTWQASLATPALRAPSVMAPLGFGWNLMLNPRYPGFAGQCRIAEICDWPVDGRL